MNQINIIINMVLTLVTSHCMHTKQPPRHIPIEEWAPASRDECLLHPHPPRCAFGDIAAFLTPPLQAMLSDLRGGELLESKLKPLVSSGKAVKSSL